MPITGPARPDRGSPWLNIQAFGAAAVDPNAQSAGRSSQQSVASDRLPLQIAANEIGVVSPEISQGRNG